MDFWVLVWGFNCLVQEVALSVRCGHRYYSCCRLQAMQGIASSAAQDCSWWQEGRSV
jgi:hypothetical protein